LTKIITKEENFKWHLEAFASELFNYTHTVNSAIPKHLNIIANSN